MWVAREKNGELYLFTKKPTRIESYGTWIWGNQNDCIKINPDEYAIKWEDEPIEVELSVKGCIDNLIELNVKAMKEIEELKKSSILHIENNTGTINII